MRDFRSGLLSVIALVVCGMAAGPSTALAGTTPAIGSEWASGVTEHNATLNAEINPNGQPTSYLFRIDTISSENFSHPLCPFAACTVAEAGPPLPPGLGEPPRETIPASEADQVVSIDMASVGATLEPGTTYFYRVIAHVAPGASDYSGSETVFGPEKSFTTLYPVASSSSPAVTPETYLTPTVEIRSSSEIPVSGPWLKVAFGCVLPKGQVCEGTAALHLHRPATKAGIHYKGIQIAEGRSVKLLSGEIRPVAIRLTRGTIMHLEKGFDRSAWVSFSARPQSDSAVKIVRLTPGFPRGLQHRGWDL